MSFISDEYAAQLRSYALEPGDLVFSRVADVGRSVVIAYQEAGWIMSSNLMRITLDRSRVAPLFAYLNLAHNEKTHEQIRRRVNAGGRDVANTAILNSMVFPWPTINEQERIVAAYNAHEARTRAEQTSLVKLRHTKQGLMDDLLMGRVRVVDVERSLS